MPWIASPPSCRHHLLVHQTRHVDACPARDAGPPAGGPAVNQHPERQQPAPAMHPDQSAFGQLAARVILSAILARKRSSAIFGATLRSPIASLGGRLNVKHHVDSSIHPHIHA
jgi:hypothetical protein